ncbi:hypothetical protein [Psychromonas sp. MME2]|uniref:hypothetical protein n=1 Tax=unclassified Psychromonas TaxID=2614957 RepID=UPI00339D0F84
MVTNFKTRFLHYTELSAKELINDLKDAVRCDVATVCCLPCNRCPYLHKHIDTKKIQLKGLRAYSIKIITTKEQHLLLSITAPDIDTWLEINNIPISSL